MRYNIITKQFIIKNTLNMRLSFSDSYLVEVFQTQFYDQNGEPIQVGQDMLDFLMAPFQKKELDQREQRKLFFQGLDKVIKDESMRYEHVDFLYWYKFQNKVVDYLEEIKSFLSTKIKTNSDIEGHIEEFGEKMQEYYLIVEFSFETMNSENLMNLPYYCYIQEIHEIFLMLFKLMVVGMEKIYSSIFDMYDSYLQQVRHGFEQSKGASPNDFSLAQSIINPLLKDFVEATRLFSSVQSKELLDQLTEQKVSAFKQRGFKKFDIPILKYCVEDQFVFKMTLLHLLLNPYLINSDPLEMSKLEENLPPQFTIKAFQDILQNPHIGRRAKVSIATALGKMVNLQNIRRFNVTEFKYNPYFTEISKNFDFFLEIFQKLAKYHLKTKVQAFEEEMGDMEVDITPAALEAKFDELESEGTDIIKSQSFMSDFINFLESMSRSKARDVNSIMFQQLTKAITDIMAAPFHKVTGRYPVNQSIQIIALKLLKQLVKSQQSFEDTEPVVRAVEKLQQEIGFVHAQSQVDDTFKWKGDFIPPHSQIFNKTWFGDDDYLRKYQTLDLRQHQIRTLFEFLKTCIQKSDAAVMNQNQNSVAHARKILELSLIQDDLLTKVFKVYETTKQDQKRKKLLNATIVPVVIPAVEFISAVFNDQPSKVNTFISNGLFQSILNSLVDGNQLPQHANMLSVFPVFMHMLLLTDDTKRLLRESGLIKSFFTIALSPESYSILFQGKEQQLMVDVEELTHNIVSNSEHNANEYIDTFITIHRHILDRCHKLSEKYVEMQHKIAEMDKKLDDATLTSKERNEIEIARFNIKQPYEDKQDWFEKSFNLFCRMNIFLDLQNDGQLATSLKEKKDQVLEMIYEGLENPVLASSLYESTKDYLSNIFSLLNMIDSHSLDKVSSQGPNELLKLVHQIIKNIGTQLQNFKRLINPEGGSSLVTGFNHFDTIVVNTRTDEEINLFECTMTKREDCFKFKEFMNKTSMINFDDKTCIVIRKIQLYLRILAFFMKMEGNKNERVEQIFNCPKFLETMQELHEMQALISRHRSQVFKDTKVKALIQLDTYLKEFGDTIYKDFDFEANKKDLLNTSSLTTDLMRARGLYYRYKVKNVKHSLLSVYNELLDQVKAINFETTSSIASCGMSMTGAYEGFLRILLSTISRKRTIPSLQNSNDQIYNFVKFIAERVVLGNKESIERSMSRDLDLSTKEGCQHFDQTVFDAITNLNFANKILSEIRVPGCFLYALFRTILDSNIFKYQMKMVASLTQKTEAHLAKPGATLYSHQAQLIKILWKQVTNVIVPVIGGRFLPYKEDLCRFLLDFNMHSILAFSEKLDNIEITLEQSRELQKEIIANSKIKITNTYKMTLYQLVRSFYEVPEIISLMNRFSNEGCFKDFFKLMEKAKDGFADLIVDKRIENCPDRIPQVDFDSVQVRRRRSGSNHVEIFVNQPGFSSQSPEEMMRTVNEAAQRAAEHDPSLRGLAQHLNPVPIAIQDRDGTITRPGPIPQDGNQEEFLAQFLSKINDSEPKKPEEPKQVDNSLAFLFDEMATDTSFLDPKYFQLELSDILPKYHEEVTKTLQFKEFVFTQDQVSGKSVRLDKAYQSIEFLLLSLSQHTIAEIDDQPIMQGILGIIKGHVEGVTNPKFETLSDLQNLAIGLYTIKVIYEGGLATVEMKKQHFGLLDESILIEKLVPILLGASKRLSEIFEAINEKRFEAVSAQSKKETEPIQLTQLKENDLPLVRAVIQFCQEIFDKMLFFYMLTETTNDCINIHKQVSKIDDTVTQVKEEPEDKATIESQIEGIQKFLQLFKSKYFDPENKDPAWILGQFKTLLQAQTELFGAFSNIPSEILIKESQQILTLVIMGTQISQKILKVSDFLDTTEAQGLRKVFKQSQGLKKLFGIKIVDSHCANASNFYQQLANSKGFLERLKGDIYMEKLVETVTRNPKAEVQRCEILIKQLMYVQYCQNIKDKTKKDITEIFKPAFEAQSPEVRPPSPSKLNKQKQLGKVSKKASNQSQKKADSKQTKQAFKAQSKQIKAIMKYYESHNQFSLSLFLDFFTRSQSMPPFLDAQYFLQACHNLCLIDIEETEVDSKPAKMFTLRIKTGVLKEMIMEEFQRQGEKLGWQAEFKKVLNSDQGQWQHDIVTELLDIFVEQSKGWKMSLLKQLHHQIIDQPLKLQLDDDQILLDTDKNIIKMKDGQEKEVRTRAMQEYVLGQNRLIKVIANEIGAKPILIGSVLKHNSGNTYKYIIRNILPILHLQLQTEKFQIVFLEQENSSELLPDTLDAGVYFFFKRMLLSQHTTRKQVVYLQSEAKRVFVKEISKNLMENEQFAWPDSKITINLKILQNYSAVVLLSQLILVQEQNRNEKFSDMDERIKALHQQIRRYSQAQKETLLSLILYETQTGTFKTTDQPNFKISLFDSLLRLSRNLKEAPQVILKGARSIHQTVESAYQVINQFSKSEQFKKQVDKKKNEDQKKDVPYRFRKREQQSTLEKIMVENSSSEDGSSDYKEVDFVEDEELMPLFMGQDYEDEEDEEMQEYDSEVMSDGHQELVFDDDFSEDIQDEEGEDDYGEEFQEEEGEADVDDEQDDHEMGEEEQDEQQPMDIIRNMQESMDGDSSSSNGSHSPDSRSMSYDFNLSRSASFDYDPNQEANSYTDYDDPETCRLMLGSQYAGSEFYEEPEDGDFYFPNHRYDADADSDNSEKNQFTLQTQSLNEQINLLQDFLQTKPVDSFGDPKNWDFVQNTFKNLEELLAIKDGVFSQQRRLLRRDPTKLKTEEVNKLVSSYQKIIDKMDGECLLQRSSQVLMSGLIGLYFVLPFFVRVSNIQELVFVAYIPMVKSTLEREQEQAEAKNEEGSDKAAFVPSEQALSAANILREDRKKNPHPSEGDNSLIQFKVLEGFDEFMKSIEHIRVRDQVPKEPSGDEASDQIDSFKPPVEKPAPMQSNQVQIKTINDFIQQQTPEIRQQILVNLDNDILQKIPSSLFVEAKKLKAKRDTQGTTQTNTGPVGQNMQRHRQQQQQQDSGFALPINTALRSSIQPGDSHPLVRRPRIQSMDVNPDPSMPFSQSAESEDITIQLNPQKLIFHPNSFYFNLIQLMKQNLESLKSQSIRDICKPQKKDKSKIYTALDLNDYCETIISEQVVQPSLFSLIDLSLESQLSLPIFYSAFNFYDKKEVRLIKELPTFRLGLIIQVVQSMNQIVGDVINHIQSQQETIRGEPFKRIQVFKYDKKLWSNFSHTTPMSYTFRDIFQEYFRLIRFLQDTVKEGRDVLDILKAPSQDPVVMEIEEKVGLLDSLVGFEVNSDGEIKKVTLEKDKVLSYSVFDQLLHVQFTFVQINLAFPQAFPQNLSVEKAMKDWKGGFIHTLEIMYERLIIKSTKENRKDDMKAYKGLTISEKTLDMTLQLLFFFRDNSNQLSEQTKPREHLLIDTSKTAVQQILTVLTHLSKLPLQIERLPDSSFKCSLDPKSYKSKTTVMGELLTDMISTEVSNFCNYFEKPEGSKSSLSGQSHSIDRILFVFKVQLSMKAQCDRQQEYLRRILILAQQIIDKEGDSAYMFKDEFKKIMLLIFTLAQADFQKIGKKQRQKQNDDHGRLSKDESKQDKKAEKEEEKNEEIADVDSKEAEINSVMPEGSDSSSEVPQNRQSANQKAMVKISSEDELKEIYGDKASKVVLPTGKDKPPEQIIQELTADFSGEEAESIERLLWFFFKNQEMINQFIIKNQSVISEQLLNLVSQVPQIFDFSSKRLLWRMIVKMMIKSKRRGSDHYDVDIGVRRNQVFGDSFEQLKDLSLSQWFSKFIIEFHDEEGIDEGGLIKEWYQLISKGIFDPNYALFLQSSKGSTYFPNPNSIIHDKKELIQLFQFVGRIIAKALIDGQLLDCYFVRAIYKMILSQKLGLQELEDFDEQVFKSLIYLLQNDADPLCQVFVLSETFFDDKKDVELKAGGKDIDVTNDNKFEYCSLVLHYRLYECIKLQIDSFLKGFFEIVPAPLIKIFDAKELELLISGLPTIDILDLKDNTIYTNFSKSQPIIQWFWEVLEEFNQVERAEFIQFVTGTSKVPVEGFKGLRGGANGSIQKVEITKLMCSNPDQKLPQAHTCFFQLDLPDYSTKDILRAKLKLSIKECKTFNIA